MQAPRLRVGFFADVTHITDVPEKLDLAGHHVTLLHDPQEIEDYELIVIESDNVEGFVEKLAAFAHRGQMFLHTSLTHNITVMDPLETAGGIVMSAHPIGQDRWVVSSVDELGETIVGLLVGEMGGSIIEITDAQRPELAAALAYAKMLASLRFDATSYLNEFLGDIQIADDLVRGAEVSLRPDLSHYDAIRDPNRKQLFRDIAQWATQKENR